MRSARFVRFASIPATFLIGYLDYRTGIHASMMLLYAVPIFTASRLGGTRDGFLAAGAAAASWLLVQLLHGIPEFSGALLTWNAMGRLGTFALLAYAVSLQGRLRTALEAEKHRADTDRLTGLLNQEAFRQRIEGEVARSRRYGRPVALAFVDLDDFKRINDTLGHAVGDRVLRELGGTIRRTIRKTDIAGRIGGDEFAVLFPEADEGAVRRAIDKLSQAFGAAGGTAGPPLTASIGVLVCRNPPEDLDALLNQADALMYAAKGKGKNAAEYRIV